MSIQLTRLCHDLVQNSYKDLHALLDSIVDDDPATRHQRLVDHILRLRHRFSRLLVAVRWFMSYSAFHYSAQATRDVGGKRSNTMTYTADMLWGVSNVARGAAAHLSAVQEAAEVLGAASYSHRIPKCIEASVGIDTTEANSESKTIQASDHHAPKHIEPPLQASKNQKEKETIGDDEKQKHNAKDLIELDLEALARLRAFTTDIVGRAIPEGVQIFKTGVPPGEAAVRIGIPGAWTADVIMDRLRRSDALLVLLRFSVMVDSSPDAVSEKKRRSGKSQSGLHLTKEQREPLRQMLNDRMRWVALGATNDDILERTKKILRCLTTALTHDCCGRLAHSHIRAQCAALVTVGIWNTGDVQIERSGDEKESLGSTMVRYWLRSHIPGSMVLSVAMGESAGESSETPSAVLTVKNNDAKSGTAQVVDPANINVEILLLQVCEEKALELMTRVRRECLSLLSDSGSFTLSRSSTTAVMLLIGLTGTSPELVFGLSLRTGGLFMHYSGSLALLLAKNSSQSKELRDCIWVGERFFSSSASLVSTVKQVVEKGKDLSLSLEDMSFSRSERKDAHHNDLSHLQDSMHSKRKAGVLFTRSFPDDVESRTSSPVIKSPGHPRKLQRQGDTIKDTARAKHHFAVTKEEGCSASSMARLVEKLHSGATEAICKFLVREMQSAKAAVVLHPSSTFSRAGKVAMSVKCTPMEAESCTLHIRGSYGWSMRIVLRQNVFDGLARYGVASYTPKTKTLSFRYPSISRNAVICFRKDILRVRTAAALVMGLSSNPGRFKLRRRTPAHVTVVAGHVLLSAGLGRRSVQITTRPAQPVIDTQLIPLIEEMLNDAGTEMGLRYGELLHRALPIGQAIQCVVPSDPKRFRVRFLTALRARYVVEHMGKNYAVEIDGRSGRDRMMVIDVARALAVTSNARAPNSSRQFSPIPVWDVVLNQLIETRKGSRMHGGAAVVIHTTLLGKVLSTIVGAFR